jgi:hypothetical protein
MQFYFSGISSKTESNLLQQAGIENALVDPTDLPNVSDWNGKIMLDSGAYRMFKSGKQASIEDFRTMLEGLNPEAFTHVVSLDVIDDPEKTKANWDYLSAAGIKTLPVWHYGDPLEYLEYYLGKTDVVGLGGLVRHIRSKRDQKMSKEEKAEWESYRKGVLAEMLKLCQLYPNRFHFFGLCWIDAVNALYPYLYSADSSLYLEAARYGYVIFINTRTKKLSHAPCKLIPQYAALDRAGRIIESARAICSYLE